jgi:hypothetical protein
MANRRIKMDGNGKDNVIPDLGSDLAGWKCESLDAGQVPPEWERENNDDPV